MLIAHVITKHAQKMTLVPSNNMVQEFTAAASDPTLGGSILPGRLHARWFRCEAQPAAFNRHVAMYLAHRVGGWSTTRIGRFYNGREQSR